MRLEQVKLNGVVPLRKAVLRPAEGDESWCTFAGDTDPRSIHFRAVVDGLTVGVISVLFDPREVASLRAEYRIRGFAVIEEYRGTGVGSKLARCVGRVSLQRELLPTWVSARLEHADWYESLGGTRVSGPYEIPGTGLHIDLVFSG